MYKIICFGIGVALSLVIFTGCGIKTSEYSVSADNNMELRKLEDIKLNVGDFDAENKGESHSLCRLSDTVSTPNGEPFSEYIKKAFIDELKMAGLYDQNAPITISAYIEKVYGSSMIGNAFWQIIIEVKSSNGKSIKVDTKRDYPSAFTAYTACQNMATSFSPTVRMLIQDIITHKDFSTLINTH